MKKSLISLILSMMIAPVFAQTSIDRVMDTSATPVATAQTSVDKSTVHPHFHRGDVKPHHGHWKHHRHHGKHHHWMKHVQKPTITIPQSLKHDRLTHADAKQVRHDLHVALKDYHVRAKLMREQLHEDMQAHNKSRVVTDLHVLKQIQMQEHAIKHYAHVGHHHKHHGKKHKKHFHQK